MERKNGLVIAIDIRPLMGGKISGVEVYTHYLLKYLFKIDQKNTYLLFTNAIKNQDYWLPPYDPSRVFFIQTRFPNKLLNASLSFLRWPKLDKIILKRIQQNNKNISNIDIFFFPDLRLSALSPQLKKIQVVHDLSFEHHPDFFSKKTHLWYKFLKPKREVEKANKIIAVSKATKDDLMKTYSISQQKIQVIYEGVEENFAKNISDQKSLDLQKKYNLPQRYFLFLATMEPRKNMTRLIEAYQRFKAKNPDESIKLVMAGVEQPKIFSQVVVPQYSQDVMWPGFIEEEDKGALIKNAQAFLYPSLFEGFGLPLVEAMKCGTPILTSNKSSMPEIVGDAGLFTDPENTQEIASGLEKILKSEVQTALKEKMKKRVEIFSWKKCARETLAVFNSL